MSGGRKTCTQLLQAIRKKKQNRYMQCTILGEYKEST